MRLSEPLTQPAAEIPDGSLDADLAALLMIRHFELALLDCFARGLVAGTTHTCLGQEYVPVAMEGLLTRSDHVLSNHRGHGHYLARFADPAGLLAEILGREGAVCGGYGGSQHLHRETYMSTGVQGESLTVAAGIALHLRSGPDGGGAVAPGRLACVYVGDGTWGEGAVYEALNLASLWGLPLLVLVENNGIAQSTPTGLAMAGSISSRAAAFDVPHLRCASLDVAEIRTQLGPLVHRVRSGSGPAVVEFTPPRLGPHSKGDDTRGDHELAALRARDWAGRYRDRHPARFARIDDEQRRAIDGVVRDVLARPLAQARDA